MRILFACLLILSAAPAFAKEKPKATPKPTAKAKEVKIVVNARLGERFTQFTLVDKKDGKPQLVMNSSAGYHLKRTLTSKNYDYIMSEFKKLPQAPKIPANCYRARMDIQVTGLEKSTLRKSSCFGVKTITSPQYGRFAGILASAF